MPKIFSQWIDWPFHLGLDKSITRFRRVIDHEYRFNRYTPDKLYIWISYVQFQFLITFEFYSISEYIVFYRMYKFSLIKHK